jgi:hypothetical protein
MLIVKTNHLKCSQAYQIAAGIGMRFARHLHYRPQ